jgi:nucleotide-binding universal stress UspA family protein
MYRRIVLAYDGTLEGRTALREGALLAKRCGAKVFLLSVVAESPGALMVEGAYAAGVVRDQEIYRSVLEEGLRRLTDFGLEAAARLVTGEPPSQIGAYASEVDADLVVVGHRKLKLIERWWSGSLGANLLEYTTCSLLVSRNTMSDEDLSTELAQIKAAATAVSGG